MSGVDSGVTDGENTHLSWTPLRVRYAKQNSDTSSTQLLIKTLHTKLIIVTSGLKLSYDMKWLQKVFIIKHRLSTLWKWTLSAQDFSIPTTNDIKSVTSHEINHLRLAFDSLALVCESNFQIILLSLFLYEVRVLLRFFSAVLHNVTDKWSQACISVNVLTVLFHASVSLVNSAALEAPKRTAVKHSRQLCDFSENKL